MKFKLRTVSGVEGTEIKVSVFFDPDESGTGLISVRDDENVSLDGLRVSGDEFQRADHTLSVLRSLCHYASLWALREDPVIAKHILHGVQRKDFLEKQSRRKKRKRK